MKNILIGILLLLLLGGVANAQPTQTGLVAAYNFSGDDVDIIVDTTGNGNNLTNSGSVLSTYAPTGVSYRAFTNDQAVGGITGLTNRSGTIEMWYRVNTAATSWKDLFGLNYTNLTSNVNTSIRVEEAVEGGKMKFIFNGFSTGQPFTTAVYENGQLVNIMVTWDKTSTGSIQCKCYVNDVYMGEGFIAAGPYDFKPSTQLYIGTQDAVQRKMTLADIYSVRLYNTTLNSTQRTLNYDGGLWMNTSAYTVDTSRYNFNVSKQSVSPQYISFELDRPANESMTVNYTVTEGTATSPENYALVDGTITFSEGQIRKSVAVTLPNNGQLEVYPKKYFNVAIHNPTGTAINLGRINSSTVSIGNQGGVAFSWDDHDYASWRDHMQPMLQDHDAAVTFFVSQYTRVGTGNFPANVLKSLQDDGNELGIHTATHQMASAYLANHTVAEYVENECLAVNTEMTADGLNPTVSMAYPYGDSGSYALRDVMPLHYLNVRGTINSNQLTEGTYKDTNSIFYAFDNTPNTSAGTLDTVGLQESEIYPAIDRAMENGEVVQLLSHRVTPVQVEYGISTAFFENLLDYADSKEAVYYTHKSMYNTQKTLYTSSIPAELGITAANGVVSVDVQTWGTSGDCRKVWTEYSETHNATTQHTIGGFPANAWVDVNCDGALYTHLKASQTGYVTWAYSGGYSEHTFEALVSEIGGMKTEASGIWSNGVDILIVVIIVMLSMAIVGLLQGKKITPETITELVIGLMIVALIVTVGYGTLSSISGTI